MNMRDYYRAVDAVTDELLDHFDRRSETAETVARQLATKLVNRLRAEQLIRGAST